jgi:hypothetical protein
MEHLDSTLQFLFPETERQAVRERVQARELLATESPAVRQWISDMQRHMQELLASQFPNKNYAEARMAILVLLAREGIVEFDSSYTVVVPETEAAPVRYLRDNPAPSVTLATDIVVTATQPNTPQPDADNDTLDDHVLGELGTLAGSNDATPQYVEKISGMLVERGDNTWLVECTIPSGTLLQVSAIADGGHESSFEMPITAHGNQSVHLRLPAHVRPDTVVFIALDQHGIVVGHGMFGEPRKD